MTTKFKVGDDIWWLDTRCVDKPRIKFNVILEIEWEKYYSRYKYVIDDNTTYIWSSNTVVAKTYEELINILYPIKMGKYELNELVYTIETNGNAVGISVTNSLVIDKAYVKGFNHNTNQYITSDKQDDSGNVVVYPAASVYRSVEAVKQAVVEWLMNNDN